MLKSQQKRKMENRLGCLCVVVESLATEMAWEV
jgi:hypothetical protein